MNDNIYNEIDAYLCAKNQITEIKDFYKKLVLFFFSAPIVIYFYYTKSLNEWILISLVAWALLLALRALSLFRYGIEWEENKIQEFMNRQKKNKNVTV